MIRSVQLVIRAAWLLVLAGVLVLDANKVLAELTPGKPGRDALRVESDDEPGIVRGSE